MALSRFNADWDVQWTPAKHGTDKCSWIHFPELKDDTTNPSFQSKSWDKLLCWVRTKALPVCNSFLGKGGVTLSMASPHHVDTMINAGTVLVPRFPSPLRVVCGWQIKIHNTFEIIIMGIPDDYEDMDQLLKEWITQKFLIDDESTLAGYRASPDEPEAFIFHMTTWKATKAVLSPSTWKHFEADFAKYLTLIYPHTIHEVNSTSIWKIVGNICSDFVKGAESMNETIKALSRHINTMEDCNQKQHKATHLQLASITSSLQNVMQAIAQLNNHLVTSQCVILAQSAELGLTGCLGDIHSNRMTLKMQLLVGMDPEDATEACTMIEGFQKEEKALLNEINQANQGFLTIVGGHVSQLQSVLSSPVSSNTPTMAPGISSTVCVNSKRVPSSMLMHNKNSDD